MRRTALILSLPWLAVSTAQAQEAPEPPAQISALSACAEMVEDAPKAACYDSALESLLSAIESGALVAYSTEQIEEARRESVGLGSFSLPGVGRIRSDRTEEPEDLEITVIAVEESAHGRLTFVTDNGQRWAQSDSEFVPSTPDTPFTIELRPAFRDSFIARIPGRRPVRVRREE